MSLPTSTSTGLAKLDGLVADVHALVETWKTADPDQAARLLGGNALNPGGSYSWVQTHLPNRRLDFERALEAVYRDDVRPYVAAINGALRRLRKPDQPVVLSADFKSGVQFITIPAVRSTPLVVGYADELPAGHTLLAAVPEVWRFVAANGRHLFILDAKPDVIDHRVQVRDFFLLEEVVAATQAGRQYQFDEEASRRQAEEEARLKQESQRRAWENSPEGREVARRQEIADLKATIASLQLQVNGLQAVADISDR